MAMLTIISVLIVVSPEPSWSLLAHAEAAADFTEDGALSLPENYREWVFLGATVSPNDINFGSAYSPGIKHAYMDPDSFRLWKQTGTFSEGTVIVQESLAADRREFMNADGYFAGKYLDLQVMVKDPKRYPDTVWGFFSFGKPPRPAKVWPISGMGETDCAGCHTYADQDWVFTRFYPMLAEAAPIKPEGQLLFERDWTPATAEVDSTGDGLGPLFQARSCEACHTAGGRGKFKIGSEGIIEGDSYVVKTGLGKYGDPIYGGLIQTHSVAGILPEGKLAVRFEMIKSLSGVELRKPIFELREAAYGSPDPATKFSGRLSPSVFGNGALEQVPLDVLKKLADPEDNNGDGISGRLNIIELPISGTVVGRFGWKAGQWSIRTQTAKAFRMEMGLSSSLMGPAWGDCTPVQNLCVEAPNGERAAKGGREVDINAVKKITAHVASLGAPPRRGQELEGEKLFIALGCAACHTPQLPIKGGSTVGAFTDLLLHDMGAGLEDGFIEGSASSSEWRTAPLMGLGRLLEKNMPLLHDGRARNADEAILWHEGEAADAVLAYTNLNEIRRKALLRFLETL